MSEQNQRWNTICWHKEQSKEVSNSDQRHSYHKEENIKQEFNKIRLNPILWSEMKRNGRWWEFCVCKNTIAHEQDDEIDPVCKYWPPQQIGYSEFQTFSYLLIISIVDLTYPLKKREDVIVIIISSHLVVSFISFHIMITGLCNHVIVTWWTRIIKSM